MQEDLVHRDLQTAFRNLGDAGSWNQAPSKFVEHIAKLHRFYKLMFSVCRNGLLPGKMLEQALKHLETCEDENGKRNFHWNFMDVPLDRAASTLSVIMRIGASKLRDLATNTNSMHISLRGASGEHAECIREICAMITITPKDNYTTRRPPLQQEAGAVVPAPLNEESDMNLDELDELPEIFKMALCGDFGNSSSVRRASSVASTATCSTSQNPLDGWPGRPTPPSGPSVAPTQMRTISPSSAADLQIVPYDGPRGPTLTKLSFDMGADSTPMAKRRFEEANESDLPSGAKVTKSDLPSDKGTHLFPGRKPGAVVADTLISLANVTVMKPVKATGRTAPKKAGGPVQPAMVRASSRAKPPATSASPNTGGKDPRRNHCNRAYRKAITKAKAAGKPEARIRKDAQAAYKQAGREFDHARS